MLAEFLLTPDAMVDTYGRDGIDAVRELTGCFFPSRATPLALVCKLGDEWERATSIKIARIANVNHRQAAMELFKRLMSSHLYVPRPTVSEGNNSENDWIAAGITSSKLAPMNKIVVSNQTTPPETLGTSINDFVSDRFWDEFPNPRLVGRETNTQERVLRAICTHSDWLHMRLPQIRGGSDDEIVTVKQIIKLSNQLPLGFRKTAIDLHVCMQQKIPEQNLICGISGELNSLVKQGVKIQLSIWPEKHFVNRELIGGDTTTTSSGAFVRRPLWLITMTHVAVGSRAAANAGEAGNTWSLFPRQKAYERYEQMSQETPLRVQVLR